MEDELIKKINNGEKVTLNEYLAVPEDKRFDLSKLIADQIYNYNANYYEFVPYINLDFRYLLSNGFMQNIKNQDEKLLLYASIYMKTMKSDILEYLIEQATTSRFGLLLIKRIYELHPELSSLKFEIEGCQKILEEKENKKKNKFYTTPNGDLVMVNFNINQAYLFDVNSQAWVFDENLFAQLASIKNSLIETIIDQEFPIKQNTLSNE